MARMPKMACAKISLARGIRSCHVFYFFCPTSVSILWRMCVHIHIPDFVDTVFELWLLTNNTVRETFLNKLGVVWSVITQQVVVISYQSFRTNYLSHPQGNDRAQKKTGGTSQLPSSPPSKGLLPAALVQPNLTWPSQTWFKFHVIRNRNEIWYGGET